MSIAEYREPHFIWKDDDGRERIIADVSWMFEDYGETLLFNRKNHTFYGLYNRFIELLRSYINIGNDNACCGFVALGKLLENAQYSNGMDVLYIGDSDLRFEFLVNIIKMLSAYPVVAINRCTLRWIKNSQDIFFYGGFSENDKINVNAFEDDICDKDSYNLIIYDVDNRELNLSRLFNTLKDDGGMLFFTRHRDKLNGIESEIYGDENIGYWKYCNAGHIEDVSLLSKIRQYRIDKLRAMLENLKEELPYLRPESFEYKYYLRNCERILRGSLNKVDKMFDNHARFIDYNLNRFIEKLALFRKNKIDPCNSFEALLDLEKMIDLLLLKMDDSEVNLRYPFTGEEKHIEFIVKNDLIKPGWWDYHTEDKKMNFYNWNPVGGNIKNDWLCRFININIPNITKELNFYNVHGDDLRPRFMDKDNKIFYVYEDVCKRFMDYRDYCASSMDLIIGGVVLAWAKRLNNKYVEFPYWIRTTFDPILDIKKIRERIEKINNAKSNCKYECALIASHDMYMSRSFLVSSLEDILDFHFPSKFNHNTDVLKKEFSDNKREYLKNFMFCACPENVSVKGWVTEKIFDAFASGTIPIYYGAHNKPIPEIINQDAVLFFDNGGDNVSLRNRILELKNNQDIYNNFFNQKKLLEGTDEYVYDRMQDLYNRLRELSM